MNPFNRKLFPSMIVVFLLVACIWGIYICIQPRQIMTEMTLSQRNDFFKDHEELSFFTIWANIDQKIESMSYVGMKQGVFGSLDQKSVIIHLIGDSQSDKADFYPVKLEFDLDNQSYSALYNPNDPAIISRKNMDILVDGETSLKISYHLILDKKSNSDQVMTVSFSLNFLEQTIYGQSEYTILNESDDQTLVDEYQTEIEDHLIRLGSLITQSKKLTLLLDQQYSQFYYSYRKYSGGEFLFKQERMTEQINQLWIIKQKFISPLSTVTFVYNQDGDGKEVLIDRNESTMFAHELYNTIVVISLNSMDHWPFPASYFSQIQGLFTPNNDPWRVETSEGSGVECLEPYSHYKFWWESDVYPFSE